MTRLALPNDPDAVIDLVEDVEVDAGELERFASRGGVILEHGHRVTVIGGRQRKGYLSSGRGWSRYARGRR